MDRIGSATLLAASAAIVFRILKSRKSSRISTIKYSDEYYLELANCWKNALVPPKQSNFRVYCIISYQTLSGDESYVTGTNSECAFIGGSLCAERIAIVNLRLRQDCAKVLKVFVVSDGAGHITPGVLCREFLAEHISLSTPVVMGGSATPFVRTLAQLYPFSSVYGRVGRDEALTVAARFAECIQLPNNADQALYKQVVTATAGDALDFLHPIRYAAGVLLSDGSVHTAAQQKALEYGNTLDPVIQLATSMLQARQRGLEVLLLLQCDQFGVLHAPFASARAFLYESEFFSTRVLVHDWKGVLTSTHAQELVPDSPAMSTLLKQLSGDDEKHNAADGKKRIPFNVGED